MIGHEGQSLGIAGDLYLGMSRSVPVEPALPLMGLGDTGVIRYTDTGGIRYTYTGVSSLH